ncbi:MAG: hypothetical protein JOZ81_34500 [Chloroflexi bacterium]|nr:hypothetical protein [Chloroflexota bacterium]MBV9543874.1 hypothetical protein [Chloroflexota bacterium]
MTTSSSETVSTNQLTQRTMVSDLLQQRGLLVGAAVAVGALWLFSRRKPPEEEAARRLVRDWRHVDDADDARSLLGSNLLPVLRPALLTLMDAVEDQIHVGFRQLERRLKHL